MNKGFLLLILVMPLLQSCGGHGNHAGKSPEVQLDNGKRWLANPETTQGIANMVALLEKNESNLDDSSIRKSFQKELEKEFQDIFKNCTMEGAGHEQLHNYLLPMKDLFEGIGANDTEQRKRNYNLLKQHLSDYTKYFE